MGMGMMVAAGAIGGLGSHLMSESSIMAKDEERVKEDASFKAREEWRMKTLQAYKLDDEKRADAREAAKDERNWKNEQDRAPVKAKLATDAAIGAKKAVLDFETENRDAISANTRAGANAKESDAERAQKEAHTDYYKANSEYTRGAKSDAAAAKASGGDDKLAGEELKAVRTERQRLEALVDKARLETNDLDGTSKWNPAKNPEQKKMEDRLIGLRLQERRLATQRAPAAAADPQNMRGTAGGDTIGNSNGPAGILNQEYAKKHAELAAAKTDEERARARTDIANLEQEARTRKVALVKPGAAAAPPAARAVTPPAPARPAPPKLTPAAPPPDAGADMMLLNRDNTAYANDPLWRSMNPAKAKQIEDARMRQELRYAAMRARDQAGE